MSEDRKKDKSIEGVLALAFIFMLISFIVFSKIVTNPFKVVPSKSSIKYYEKVIQHDCNFYEHWGAHGLSGVCRDIKRKYIHTVRNLLIYAKKSVEYTKEHKESPLATAIGVLGIKKSKNIYIKKFFREYFKYILYRMEISIMDISVSVVTYEVLFIIFLVSLALYLFLKEFRKFMQMKKLVNKGYAFFIEPNMLGKFIILEGHPLATSKFIPNVDNIRRFVEQATSGSHSAYARKLRKIVNRGYVDKEIGKYIKGVAILSALMMRSMTKNGEKWQNVPYPASITGHHNPHPSYGLLTHSLCVAITSVAMMMSTWHGNPDTDEFYEEYVKTFFSAFAHDAGKIRLFWYGPPPLGVVNAEDAVEGDKHIREAKKQQKKSKPKWFSFSSHPVQQEIQKNILLSKAVGVFPDREITEKYVKPADHLATETELRYTALGRKKRNRAMRLIFARILRIVADTNRSGDAVRLNTFDESSIGLFKENAVYLFASTIRFAPRAVRDVLGENGQLFIPCSVMPKGNKPDPFAYAFSQFLIEDGGMLSTEVTLDKVGLMDIEVGKTEYKGVWKINPRWLQEIADIEDITIVVENSIKEKVIERSRIVKDETKTIYMGSNDGRKEERHKANGTCDKNTDLADEKGSTVDEKDLTTEEGEGKNAKELPEEPSGTENILSPVVNGDNIEEVFNLEQVNTVGFENSDIRVSEKEIMKDIMEGVLDNSSPSTGMQKKKKEKEKENQSVNDKPANKSKGQSIDKSIATDDIVATQEMAWNLLIRLYKKSKFTAKRPWASELFTVRDGKRVIDSSVLGKMKRPEVMTVKSIIMNTLSVYNCSKGVEQFYRDLADKIVHAWEKKTNRSSDK